MCNCNCSSISIPRGQAGAAGTNGTNGTNGADGVHGAISFRYAYSTNTASSDPGSGTVKFNNAAPASATEMYISETEAGGVDISAVLLTMDDSASTIKALVQITKASDNTKFIVYQLTATITDNGTWETWTINHLASSATLFSNNDEVVVSISRVGDKGATGAAGAAGATGSNGKSIHITSNHSTLSGISSPANGDVALLQLSGEFYQYSGGVWTLVYHSIWDSFNVTNAITTFVSDTGSMTSVVCKWRLDGGDVLHVNIQGALDYNAVTKIQMNLAASLATGYGLPTTHYSCNAYIIDSGNDLIIPLSATMFTSKVLEVQLTTSVTPAAFTAATDAILAINLTIPVYHL